MPVVEANTNRARSKYLRAARKGLWTELRLDYLEQPGSYRGSSGAIPGRSSPPTACNQKAATGPAAKRSAAPSWKRPWPWGPTFWTWNWPRTSLGAGNCGSAGARRRLILSWHDFSGTPDATGLEAIFHKMLAQEADIIKMVTLAQKPEDNLRLLSLIPQALAAGKEIIAFCMGPLGKWSRLAAPLLGSFLTFAPFTKKGASAPGQLTVNEVKKAVEIS